MLQLAIHTTPPNNEGSVFSALNYHYPPSSYAPDPCPPGYVPNDPASHHFYPVYVNNSLFSKWDGQDCLILTKYIQYSPDFTHITGIEAIWMETHTIPVYLGR